MAQLSFSIDLIRVLLAYYTLQTTFFGTNVLKDTDSHTTLYKRNLKEKQTFAILNYMSKNVTNPTLIQHSKG